MRVQETAAAARQEFETLSKGLVELDGRGQTLGGVRLADRAASAPEDNEPLERLRQRVDLLDDFVRDLSVEQNQQQEAIAGLAATTQSLRERVEANPRDEQLRQDVEGFQNKLAADQARIQDQFARQTAFQALLEATRAELVQSRQEAQRSADESRRLHRALQDHMLRHEGHAAPPNEDDEGDELQAIEGIGQIFQERLRADGIMTFDDLREAYPDEVAAAVGTTRQRVRQWQDMAELMRVPGVGPQFAELLVLSEIRSIQGLAAMGPDEVLAKVQARTARRRIRITREPYDRSAVESWIRAARTMMDGDPGPASPRPLEPPGPKTPDPAPGSPSA